MVGRFADADARRGDEALEVAESTPEHMTPC